MHFSLFHSQMTKKSMYPLHKYVHSVVISTCCFFVNRCWSHGALLSDAFIFLTKIAIPAISLYQIMAVEMSHFKNHQNTMYQFTVQTILFDSTFLLPVGQIHILLCILIKKMYSSSINSKHTYKDYSIKEVQRTRSYVFLMKQLLTSQPLLPWKVALISWQKQSLSG